MRQGQHKSRQRNRGPRRQGNPSNRVYESNGPDVKVPGTAQTVADKYLQLARDSVSAGDTVTAESYFQHAEHYLRIIAANQAYQQQQQNNRQGSDRDFSDRESNESGSADDGDADDTTARADEAPGTGPQPGMDDAAARSGKDDRDSGDDRSPRDAKSSPRRARSARPPSRKNEGGDVATFDGQTPDFLTKPVSPEPETADAKPKRAPRASGRARAVKTNGTASDTASAEGGTSASEAGNADAGPADTEAVAS